MAAPRTPAPVEPTVGVPPYAAALARLCGAALDRALSQQLLEREEGRVRLIRTAFWPSDLFSCRRKVGLGFREVPRDETAPRLLEVRHWGTVVHEEYYRRLMGLPSSAFRVLATEEEVTLWLPGMDTPLRGKYDAMVAAPAGAVAQLVGGSLPDGVDPAVEVRFLVDIKTVTPYVAREVAETGCAQKGDRAEMTCYLRATGIPFGIVIYHDKTAGIRELAPVVYDEGFFGEIVDWIRSVYAPVRAGEIPPRDFDPETTDFPCSYCPFRSVCLELGPGSFGLPPQDPAPSTPSPTSEDSPLRARAQALLLEIVRMEDAARDAAAAAEPLRRELMELLRQLGGRVEAPGASATLVTSPRWDRPALAARLAELGRLADTMDVSLRRVQQLIRDGALPASLLADARRAGTDSLRITRRKDGIAIADGGGVDGR